VKEFPIPHDKKTIQRFLGLTSYFRKLINGYPSIARPLSDILRGDSKYEFGEEQQFAFEKLKTALISEPVVKLYNPYKRKFTETRPSTGLAQSYSRRTP